MYDIRDVMQGVLCAVLVSITYVITKLLGGVLSPVELCIVRFVTSVLCFLPFIQLQDFLRLKRDEILLLIAAGLTGIFAYNMLMFMALESTAATNVALINAINPVMTMLGTALVFKHKISGRQLFAFLLALIGVGIVVTKGQLDVSSLFTQKGDLYMLIASFIWVLYSLAISILSHRFSGSFITCAAGMVGLVPMFALSGFGVVSKLATLAPIQLGYLVYLGTFGTVGVFITFLHTVKTLGPSMASFILFSLLPLLVALLSYFVFGAQLEPAQAAGGLLILIALAVTVRTKKAQA